MALKGADIPVFVFSTEGTNARIGPYFLVFHCRVEGIFPTASFVKGTLYAKFAQLGGPACAGNRKILPPESE